MDGPVSARVYHDRTKHSLERYALGPETLDWTAPPDPFRSFAGAARVQLPLCADALTRSFFALHLDDRAPALPSLESIGALFELTFAAGRADVVERLLAHGANASLRPLDDYSALEMASSIECVWLLRGDVLHEPRTAGRCSGAGALEKRA
jgi:hypothetical protein